MGKFDVKANPANQKMVEPVAQSEDRGATGSMPAVTGPDVRQIVGMAGIGAVQTKLNNMCSAQSPMLGRLQVAGPAVNYLLA